MKYPKELQYVKSHEWIKKDGDTAIVGITDYAQDQLGDIVFVNLPQEGDEVEMGEAISDIESVKAVSDIYSPFTGVVSRINEELLDTPEIINADPYDAWLFEIKEIKEEEELFDAKGYEKIVAEEA